MIEGVGDHACEDMTGGEAYVLDPKDLLAGLTIPQLVSFVHRLRVTSRRSVV